MNNQLRGKNPNTEQNESANRERLERLVVDQGMDGSMDIRDGMGGHQRED